jgi:hypothetical protein
MELSADFSELAIGVNRCGGTKKLKNFTEGKEFSVLRWGMY